MKENVLILGASKKPHRYSYKAMIELNRHGYQTHLIGRKAGEIEGNQIYDSFKSLPENIKIDTITVYLNAKNQSMYEESIIKLNPRRVIFNPGAENARFYSSLLQHDIKAVNACTLVMLSIGTY